MFPTLIEKRNGFATQHSKMEKSEKDIEHGIVKVKPKVVIFYKNGDRHFNGFQVSITPRRFRNFENLLNELTRITKLPHGVRFVFTPSEGRLIHDLHQLENGKSYVCASFRKFKKLDYGGNNGGPEVHSRIVVERRRFRLPSNGIANRENRLPQDGTRNNKIGSVKPRIITVVRYGYTKPRKTVKVLLNRKTAQTFDQVLNDITSAVGVEGSSGVRKLYTVEGQLVNDLSHLLNNGSVFIAVGNEKFNPSEVKDVLQREVQPLNSNKDQESPRGIVWKKNKHGSDRAKADQNEMLSVDDNENISKPEKKIQLSYKKRTETDLNKNDLIFDAAKNVETNNCESDSDNGVNIASPKNIVTLPKIQPEDPINVTDFEVSKNSQSPLPKIAENQSPRHRKQLLDTTKNGRKRRSGGSVADYYDIGRKLGDGNFAVVREVTDKENLKPYALKIIDCSKIKGKESMIRNEIDIMKSCRHPNIVQLYEDYHTPSEIFLVMELISGGDLFDLVSNAIKFSEKETAHYVIDICGALNYLHKRNIVHRDLKPENLLVHVRQDGNKMLKLADFGLAMEVTEPIYTVCGTPTYVAPEILNESGYGLEVDMWAAGVITYIMLCGFPPFRSAKRRQSELFDLIESGEFEFLSPYWDNVSKEAKDMVARMLVVDRSTRYSAEETLNHPWIKENNSDRTLTELPALSNIEGILSPRRRFKAAALTVQGAQRLKMLASNFHMSRGEKVLTHLGTDS